MHARVDLLVEGKDVKGPNHVIGVPLALEASEPNVSGPQHTHDEDDSSFECVISTHLASMMSYQ